MHNTESGRKINHAVNTTSRAVGGALSTAKGAFSNWWSAITTTPPIQPPSTPPPPPPVNQIKNNNAQLNEDEIDELPTEVKEENYEVGKDIIGKEKELEKDNNNKNKDEKRNVDKKLIELAEEADILDSNRQIFTV